MNWIVSCYRRIPDRVRIGAGGLAFSAVFVFGPSAMTAVLRALS